MVYQQLRQSTVKPYWKRWFLVRLRRPFRLLALACLYIIFTEIAVKHLFSPIRLCLKGREEHRREVHVWQPDEEAVVSGQLEVRLASAALPLHVHTSDQHFATTSGLVSYWPPFNTLFGLDLLSHHAPIIARITIARMLGGLSVERQVHLMKKPPLHLREVFWYSGDRLQTHLFLSYPESPFLLYWLRTYRERRGLEMRLSKLKVKPELLFEGGILESNCSWEKELDKVMMSEEFLGIRLTSNCPTSVTKNYNEL